MRTFTALSAMALATLITPALAGTQDPAKPAKDTVAKPAQVVDENAHYASAAKLIGMDVWSRPALDGDRKDIGDVKDFVVDNSGRITQVVVSSGGVGSLGDTLRQIQFADLKFDRTDKDNPKVWLDLTEESFQALPAIDEKTLDRYRCETIAAGAPKDEKGVREAGGDERTQRAREAQMTVSQEMLASEIDDLSVRAQGAAPEEGGKPVAAEKLGSVDEAWIDCANGKLVYLTVKHDGKTLVVPMEVLKPRVDAADEAVYVAVPVTAAVLATAPALDKDKGMVLESREFRDKVDRFYRDKR